MNRKLWTSTITERYCPQWSCPTCHKGIFAVVPRSLVSEETKQSKRERHQENSTFVDVEYRFAAQLKCGNPHCADHAVIVGIGGLDEEMQHDGWEYEEYFVPKFCIPMPDMIVFPGKCPAAIKTELRSGFKLFWADPAAAANRVRAAVERIMDHCRIPQRRKTAKGKLDRLSLHGRLLRFQERNKIMGTRLMAIKWLGNTGSHQPDLKKEDVLDALEILEDTLIEMFELRTERLTMLTQGLMKKHAPKTKKK